VKPDDLFQGSGYQRAANEDLSIGLTCHGPHDPRIIQPGIEGSIERTVWIQPGQTPSSLTIIIRETGGGENLAVGFDENPAHRLQFVRARNRTLPTCSGIETGID
jgi:hypothetical protein